MDRKNHVTPTKKSAGTHTLQQPLIPTDTSPSPANYNSLPNTPRRNRNTPPRRQLFNQSKYSASAPTLRLDALTHHETQNPGSTQRAREALEDAVIFMRPRLAEIEQALQEYFRYPALSPKKTRIDGGDISSDHVALHAPIEQAQRAPGELIIDQPETKQQPKAQNRTPANNDESLTRYSAGLLVSVTPGIPNHTIESADDLRLLHEQLEHLNENKAFRKKLITYICAIGSAAWAADKALITTASPFWNFIQQAIQGFANFWKNKPLIQRFNPFDLIQYGEQFLQDIKAIFLGHCKTKPRSLLRSLGHLAIIISAANVASSNAYKSQEAYSNNTILDITLFAVIFIAMFSQRMIGSYRFITRLTDYQQAYRKGELTLNYRLLPFGIAVLLGNMILAIMYAEGLGAFLEKAHIWNVCGVSLDEDPDCTAISTGDFWLLYLGILSNIAFFSENAFGVFNIQQAYQAEARLSNLYASSDRWWNEHGDETIKPKSCVSCRQVTRKALAFLDQTLATCLSIIGIMYSLLSTLEREGLEYFGIESTTTTTIISMLLSGVSIFLVNGVPAAQERLKNTNRKIRLLKADLYRLGAPLPRSESTPRHLNRSSSGAIQSSLTEDKLTHSPIPETPH